MSFGHAAFFGVGAYTLGLLVARIRRGEPVAHAAALAIARRGCAALVVGVFVLRTRGIYFIMVTLAFAQMFYFFFHDTKIGGGSDGLYINFKPERDRASSRSISASRCSSITSCSRSLVLVLRLPGAPAALAVRPGARRDPRERAAHASLGFPVYRYKLASFTLAGALAGLAGYSSPCQYGFVNPESCRGISRATCC